MRCGGSLCGQLVKLLGTSFRVQMVKHIYGQSGSIQSSYPTIFLAWQTKTLDLPTMVLFLATKLALLVLVFAQTSWVLASPAPPLRQGSDSVTALPLPLTLNTRRLDGPELQTYVELLAGRVSYLGYDASSFQQHWQSLSFMGRMAEVVRLQMTRYPDKRQFIPLADNHRSLKVYAMPLTISEFGHWRTILGHFAGDSGYQRVMILGVIHNDPTALTLYRGPALEVKPKVELYGIVSVTHAQTLHIRMEIPWFGQHVAVPLKDILLP